jgi:hypothetical protein
MKPESKPEDGSVEAEKSFTMNATSLRKKLLSAFSLQVKDSNLRTNSNYS